MRNIRHISLVAATVGLAAYAAMAQAVPFSITSVSFSPDSGYGHDECEKYGTLLDAKFSTTNFVAQSFSLNSAGDSHTFDFGTIDLEEASAFGGIRTNETNYLGVTATLTVSNPVGTPLSIQAIGTAYVGPVVDSHVDYTLTWNPIFVEFGTGGQFEIALNDLLFSGNGVKTQTATVTLWTAESSSSGGAGGGAVPEPATLALLGLSLTGLALSRRRR